MIARAPLAGVSRVAREDITLRRTAVSDQSFCRALFHEDRGADFAPLNLDPRTLTALLDQQFHAQQTAYLKADGGADDLIVQRAGAAIGRLKTSSRDRNTLHLIDIVLSVAVRGQGIGTNVMRLLHDAARAQGATRMTLSVLRHNERARRFYERDGFRATSDDGVRIAMMKSLDASIQSR